MNAPERITHAHGPGPNPALRPHAAPPARVQPETTGMARWIIAIGLTLAVGMDALNGTIFSMARPHIMGDTGATSDEAAWVNLGYLMAKVACLPAAAWMADRFGETRAFLWSLAIIVATSVLCASTTDLAPFVVARVAQGAGGAGLLVAAQTLLFRLFPGRKQGLVQALYALGAVMAPTSLAPAVQGWLTDHISWTWVFRLNPGLALVSLLCLAPFRQRLPNARRSGQSFDWIGFGFFALAMAALVYVLLEGARWNWFDTPHIALWATVGTAALALVTGRLILGKAPSGFLERSVFGNAHFAFGFFVSFVAGFVLFGSAFLIPAFALNVLGMPPADAGALLLPSSLALGCGLLIAGYLITVRAFDPFRFVPLGVGLVIAAMWMLSRSNLDSGAHDLWAGLLLRGLGLGFLFLAITLITLNNLKPAHTASGVALFNLGRQMGGIIGISFLTTYLDRQIAVNRRVLIENVNPASLPFQERQAALSEALTGRGLNPGLADEGAATLIGNGIQAQVAALSLNDAFFSLIGLFVVAIPLIVAFKLLQKLTGWSG